ncbi:hypothetical protein TDCHD05_200005 [Tenacibaculum dicentrarchi]|nr:hypothetical protein TDCHD05_200005 [Tenacibaculum dicentrarchi]
MKTITKSEITKALESSGYLLEDRINKKLNASNWHTIPNSRFIDEKTEIEREIDIVAFKNISENKDNFYDSIDSTLIIECMNNKEPIVFFENLEKQVSRIASLNYNVLSHHFGNILSIAQNNLNSKSKLIYSSQYCGFQRVQKLIKEHNNGWIASHPNDKHNSSESLFKYIKFHQKKFENYETSPNRIMGFFYRCVIILQGDLLAVNQNNELEIKEVNHIKYQIPKTDNNGRYFDIDVITEKYLSKYLKNIEIEDNEIANLCSKDRNKLT